MESLTHIPTPSIPLQTPQLLAEYAKRLPPLQHQLGETTVFIPADTTGLSGTSNKIRIADNTVLLLVEDTGGQAITGTASVIDVRPKNRQFPYNEEVVTPINRRITSLLAEVAVHRALTAMSGEWITQSVPGIVLKSSQYFAECSRMGVGTVERSSESDSIAGILLPDEVSAFASAHGLRFYLAETIKIIRQVFTTQQDIALRYEHDYEAEHEWLCIDVRVIGDVDATLEQYDSYVRQFNRLVPWPDRTLIRLNYDIA